MSKFVRLWLTVLGAGLVAGLIGVWQEGWRTAFPGVIVWFVLLCCVLIVHRREQQSHNSK